MTLKDLSNAIYPNVNLTVDEILKKYPPRNLKNGQVVTRYAPSPTGMMHIGNFFQMFISYSLRKTNGGVFFLRVEDTDEQRTVKEAAQVIYQVLDKFGIKPDEYQTLDGKDIGNYGPYVQTQRLQIYQAFAKKLVAEGKAFPCFCKKTEGKADVLEQRKTKFVENDEREYDPCRDMPIDEAIKRIKAGEKYAIRLKTKNIGTERVKFYDLIKGEIEAKANAKDFVLIKNDGVPPYAFAHAIDDTLMGTTIVVRGEEYIGSTPMHIELFEALGFKPTIYCHNPLIWKIGENGNRRKISKRYDPEFNMQFYFQQGYPNDAVFEYLLNLISSKFEKWRFSNPNAHWSQFKFDINDITAVSPVFDMVKLNDISKNVFAKMSATEVYDGWHNWAKEYDLALAKELESNKEKYVMLCNIDREKPKPRKDIYCYGMIKDYFDYIFARPTTTELENGDEEKYAEFVKAYAKDFKLASSKEEWFEGVKKVAMELGYAVDNKSYKENPTLYKGNTAKACEFLRLALTGRKNSPDLYEIMQVLGESEVKHRLDI